MPEINKIKDDKNKKKIKIGSWIITYNPAATHLMSSLGFKWLCIDMEHSTITFDQMEILISIIESNDAVPFVRVGSNDKLYIKKALDAGAQGIIVPMVNTVEEAKEAIDATYYYPKGKRGVGWAKAQNFGYNFDQYIKNKSDKIQLIFQIESIEAIQNLNKILDLKNITGTILGPYDLSASLGVLGQLESPLVKNAIKKYEEISLKKKTPMGIHITQPNPNKIKLFHNKRYKLIASGNDMIFLGNSCKDFLKKLSS
jgi:2-dehydro-3-deoxyglucarate aldolase|tara:strand:- start:974 stop:1741 length:768 start_codon:yes stop_codon:yes gene_type:complete